MKNILKNFSDKFVDADDMWNKLNDQFKSMLKQDPEMTDGIARLAGTIDEFHQASEIMAKPDGINIDEALKIINNKVKAKDDSDYSFLLFVLLKNLEHSGLIKIISKPERIVKKAMKKHAEKRPYKVAK